MANQTQLTLLRKGVAHWNAWRSENPNDKIDLMSADLYQADLSGIDFHDADLRRINLREVNLTNADLSGADLYRANMNRVNLNGAKLLKANLYRVYLGNADLSNADLRGANLQMSLLYQTTLEGASLHKALIHGISTWDLKGNPADQSELIITRDNEAIVTVDDLKMAQFVYLLLTNNDIRSVIQTVTCKAVLILGRFYEERKIILDALREELKKNDLAPIIFDFVPSENRDLTETVQLLASMSKFVIADLTDAKSLPQELSHIIPFFPSIPIRPILLEGEKVYAMYEHWEKFNSVLPIFHYKNKKDLLDNLEIEILEVVENWKNGIDMNTEAGKKLIAQQKKFKELKESNPELYQQLLQSGIIPA